MSVHMSYSESVCVCVCVVLTEDGADVYAAAGLTHHSRASKRKDFPSLFQISQDVQMGTDTLPK